MQIEILLSMMNLLPSKIPDLSDKNITTNVLVVNQTNSNGYTENANIRLASFAEKGLSKSRNRSLELACGEICIFADDDVHYLPDYEERIVRAFEEYPDADFVTFQIMTPDGESYKNYSPMVKKHNCKTVLRVSSIEIAFRLANIKGKNIRFDENFGLGSLFPSSEENIFLADALQAGLIGYYYPKAIVVHSKMSSGQNFDLQNVQSRGAVFARIFGKFYYIINIIFALKKYKKSQFTFFQFFGHLMKGAELFSNSKS